MNIVFIILIILNLLGALITYLYYKREPRNKKENLPTANNQILLMISLGISLLVLIFSWRLTLFVENYVKESRYKESSILIKSLTTVINEDFKTLDNTTAILSGSPAILKALEEPTETNKEAANLTLDRYQGNITDSICYLLDSTGTTLASSNRFDDDSFLGNNYSFRPYFTITREGLPGHYFALGITSGKRGYYSSAPVLKNGRNLGTVVIKQNIDFLEKEFQTSPYVFMANGQGIIFLSSKKNYLFRSLWPLDKETQEELKISRQFGNIDFNPLFDEQPGDNTFVFFKNTRHLVNLQTVDKVGWVIVSLEEVNEIRTYNLILILITLLVIVVIIFFTTTIAYYRTKQWLEKIYSSEQRFRTIFDNAPGILIILSKDNLLIQAINSKGLEELEYPPEEIFSAPVDRIFRQSFEGDLEVLKKRLSDLQHLYTRNHEPIEVIISHTSISYKNEDCLLLLASDISQLRKVEQALVMNEELYKEMLDTLPQIIFETDLKGNIIYANEFGINSFGFDFDDPGQTNISIFDLVDQKMHESVKQNIQRLIYTRHSISAEYLFIRKNRTCFTGLSHSIPIIRNNHVVRTRGFIIDISRQKEQDEERQRINKLESIGVLAGGLAHDFNNILTSINNGINFISIKQQEDKELTTLLGDLKTAIRRGKDITHQLLTFSKGGAPVKEISSIKELITSTSEFILSGSNCVCEYDFQEDLWPVDIDKGQISQVIQNLILNASQAMPKGGSITVKATNVTLSDQDLQAVSPGDYIKLEIKDQGIGIPEENRKKVFDPFYTTKNKGNGLGLATVHSIVMRHKGTITLESMENEFTLFTIYLPAARQEAYRPLSHGQKGIKKGSGHILLMDDDPLVLKTCRKLIEYLGYDVTTAKNGEEAIRIYKDAMEQGRKFSVVIIDLTILGGMGGVETIEKLKSIDKDVKAVVSSGYSNDPVMANYKEFGFSGMISKPYKMDLLSQVLDHWAGDNNR